jgi:hypothetical protein
VVSRQDFVLPQPPQTAARQPAGDRNPTLAVRRASVSVSTTARSSAPSGGLTPGPDV